MTRTLLISTALLACACSRDAQRSPVNHDPATASPQSAATAHPTATTGSANDTITVVGCLQGDGRFVVTNAAVDSRAGESAPAIATGSTIALDSVPADARSHVNKQVRVTGHFEPSRSDASRTASPSGGSTSTRDDVRANSTTVASDAPAASRGGRLIVERVQPIADSCQP